MNIELHPLSKSGFYNSDNVFTPLVNLVSSAVNVVRFNSPIIADTINTPCSGKSPEMREPLPACVWSSVFTTANYDNILFPDHHSHPFQIIRIL